MSGTIFVSGLVLHAHHGVGEEEARLGQRFVLDIAADVDLAAAAASDQLDDTVSYADIVAVVTESFTAKRNRLLEAAAGRVADALIARFPAIAAVRVTLRKPHAPIAAVFADVGVIVTRARNG